MSKTTRISKNAYIGIAVIVMAVATGLFIFSASTSAAMKESRSAVFQCLNDWIGDPDMDGSVGTWKERLSSEDKEHFRTSACLRKEVKQNRPGAVEL